MTAVAELYQVPLDQFVAERKRLAKESGDKSLLERKKPSISRQRCTGKSIASDLCGSSR